MASTRDVMMKDEGRYSQPRSVSGDSDRKAFSDSVDTEMDGGGGGGGSSLRNRYRSASRSNVRLCLVECVSGRLGLSRRDNEVSLA